ncbi:MAG TPA: stage III sporulation protein AA [Symbiobacteriaceae bacterium]
MMPRGMPAEVLSFLAPRLAAMLRRAAEEAPAPVEEVRVREGRPLQMVYPGGDAFVTADGRLTPDPARGEPATHDDLVRSFQLMAQGSVYAWEEEVRSGFLTLPGGHRVGLAGRVVLEEGRIRTIKHVSSLNIRIAREVKGCAAPLLPRIIRGGRVLSTLIFSPPQAGKTTLLRDLVRQISTGVAALGLRGQKVGLVDERSEVAACSAGVPQRDVGPRTDVLDGCPKAEGMMLLIRALSPDVIAVDEIGRPADAVAVKEALHAGVSVIATAHAGDLASLARRSAMAELLQEGAFQRAVLLGRSRGPGTVERVFNLDEAGGDRIAAG